MRLAVLALFIVAGSIYAQDSNIINPPGCGRRQVRLNEEDKIVNGINAQAGAWPWQAILYSNGRFSCGGSLINSQWILTAAHCTQPATASIYTFEVGTVNIGSTVRLAASAVYNHPNYNSNNFQNDISLVKLSAPVTYGDYIQPICLPDTSKTCDGTFGWATGFGRLSNNGNTATILQELYHVFPTNTACRNQYQFVMPSYNTSYFVCAGNSGGNQGICFGDSGGPLVIQDTDQTFYECGLSSWITTPCGNGGVFTRISSYLDWITQTIQN